MTTLTRTNSAILPPPMPRSHPFDLIQADLEECEKVFEAALAGYRSPVGPLIAHLKHYQGKRLRPALLLLTARAFGQTTPAHHTLAAVVEMIHTATLVHDDVLDEAETRRHVPTFNAEWGNKIAILLGDMLFTKAFHLTSTVDGRSCQLIGEATNRVCAGELRQVCERGNIDLDEATYFSIIEGKTAALTEVSTRLGALHAGAGEEVAQRIGGYGRCLGIAFQIADDLLDLTGDTARVGKTLGTDLEQGKMTLPLIHALRTLPQEKAEALRSRLKLPQATDREAVVATLHEAGSIAYARRVAEDHARQARQALEGLPRSEARVILEHLADWSVSRDK